MPCAVDRPGPHHILGRAATVLASVAGDQRFPTRVVREFKRRIGDPVPILVGGAPHSPQALAGRLLRWVVDRVVERASSASTASSAGS